LKLSYPGIVPLQREAHESGRGAADISTGALNAGARTWLGVSSIALGVFVVVTAEQLPIGLLTGVSRDLGISEGQAGSMVTLPGLVAAVCAPLVPILIESLDRRIALILLMALMIGASFLSAVASSYSVLLGARILVGVSIGGFWAIAGGLAPRLVPEASVPRATSLIFGGVAAASVLGIPLGTLIGEALGWRSAFAALALASALVLVGIAVAIPGLRPSETESSAELVHQFHNPAVLSGLVLTLLLVVGQFAVYTYVSPISQSLMGVSSSYVGPLLLGYGVAGVLGNFIIGVKGARHLTLVVMAISVLLTGVMISIAFISHSQLTGVLTVITWGFIYGGVSVTLQNWMLKAAPDAAEAATSLWVCVFNLAIAAGAFVGGTVADTLDLRSVATLGAVLFIVAAGAAIFSRNRLPG
jgi:predicted MFS family arabinose efflux permease